MTNRYGTDRYIENLENRESRIEEKRNRLYKILFLIWGGVREMINYKTEVGFLNTQTDVLLAEEIKKNRELLVYLGNLLEQDTIGGKPLSSFGNEYRSSITTIKSARTDEELFVIALNVMRLVPLASFVPSTFKVELSNFLSSMHSDWEELLNNVQDLI